MSTLGELDEVKYPSEELAHGVAGVSDRPAPFGARRSVRSRKASEAIQCREFVTRDP